MPITGEECIAKIRQQTDTILLAFSCGKDAIGSWLACRPHFSRIVPYYMYLVPDLEFVERSIRYYEDFFGQPIIRVPHPSLYRMLNELVFQTPSHASVIDELCPPDFAYLDMQDTIRDSLTLSPDCYVASGVRAVDSPYRMTALNKYGPISHKKRQFMPIWDWRKNRLVATLAEAKVKLPMDYRWFGRSFDGIDYRFLLPLKQHAPDDYARVLQWFPLAEAEIKRREYAQQF